MFPEFDIMRYAFFFLMAWGLTCAMIGRHSALFSWVKVLFAYVIWAMWDMYSWGYRYGHDLDPHAAIKVEGMAYQPPLFGHKKLLNFDAWSLPDTGGWILFAVISLACLALVIEWRWPKKQSVPTTAAQFTGMSAAPLMAIALLFIVVGCSKAGPPTIDFGKVECSYCRMNVMDEQFASAVVTKGGRTYAFDSPECMVAHVADGRIAETEVASWWVCDHVHPGTLIDATAAYYLHSDALHSPMNGNTAAFASSDARAKVEAQAPGDELDWAGARALLTSH